MKPVKFEGWNVFYAKDQPEYIPLPAHRTEDGVVTSCWELSKEEIEEVAKSGILYCQVFTFNNLLQPTRLQVGKPGLNP